jgi:hypothetical protein
MDGLEELIELHAMYGFKTPIMIDLETVDSDWLDGHCDVVGFARSKAENPPGLWLARGCVVEVSEVRLVAAEDERAVQTISGPTAVHFTRAARTVPSTRWKWANAGDSPLARRESPRAEHREVAVRVMRTDLARQAARQRAPMCHGVTHTLNLDVELTNQPGWERNRIKCEDLTSSPLREWATPA